MYSAVPVAAGEPRVRLTFWEKNWAVLSPFSDAGGSYFGERPVVTATEFFVTPFDLFVHDSVNDSIVSEWAAGQIIGLRFWVVDNDEPGSSFPRGVYYLPEYSDEFWSTTGDAMLLGAGQAGDSAVEEKTWGRIKASFGQ